MDVLTLKDVVYEYRNKHHTVRAVDGFTYGFEPGIFYAIVGKSGSGKTTLLSMLAGLDLPTSGNIDYKGKPMTDINSGRYRLRDAAMVYQSFNLFPLLTVMENCMFQLRLKGIPTKQAKEKAAEALSNVGLTGKFHKRFPAMLSGGEQQRVAIARALSSDAGVILADEPTGNLDSENTAEIVKLLSRFAHDKGLCVIVVTHDSSVSDVADVTLRMSDGRLIT